jgi:outer membrane protein OmpA-like peptidoglycan-associated protein
MKDNIKFYILICLFFSTISLQAGQKAPLIAKDFISENTLHDAVRSSDMDAVKYLVNQGIKINQQDQYGYTPLHLAVRLHNTEITKYLLDHGATPNTVDKYKDTPLLDATRNDDTDISRLLICKGAKRDVVNSNGISTLHNTVQNKNKEITNLLRVDNLAPYCQKEIKISMDKFVKSPSNINAHKICGKIEKGYVITVDVEFQNKDDEIFGPFEAKIDDNNKKWCLDVEKTTLQDGVYDVTAIAKDYVVNESKARQLEYAYAEFLTVKFDDKKQTDYPYPKICGSTNSDALDKVTVTVESNDGKNHGSYVAQIDNNAKTWCVDVVKKLDYGLYTLKGVGMDLYNQFDEFIMKDYRVGKINSNKTINKFDIKIEIPGLYDALMDEFHDDFKKWNASLDNETLVFRFNDPSMLFPRGGYKLKEKFKKVMDDFFPRYVKIVRGFSEYIKQITIEGHSSSEHSQGKTKKEKFKLNQILSAKRANEVLSYTSLITAPQVADNIIWMVTTFKAKGFSSSQLIFNQDGTENKQLSRRVDFRITVKK